MIILKKVDMVASNLCLNISHCDLHATKIKQPQNPCLATSEHKILVPMTDSYSIFFTMQTENIDIKSIY